MQLSNVESQKMPRTGLVQKSIDAISSIKKSFLDLFGLNSKLNYVLGAVNEETIFNLKYSPKGIDLSEDIKNLIASGTRIKSKIKSKIKSEIKDKNTVEPIVLARVPVNLKLTKDVIDIILLYQTDPQQAQKLHYSKLTMEEGTSLGALVREFPKDLKIIQNLLEITPKLGYDIKQRFSSFRGYGLDLYITKK